ncbi:lecithin retinol acyltransferase family protein [Anaerobiospirillum sp. NML120448]|uniref:lecithin retinol acyltransferase family protein n=1 Tax=Anaerobiospirillum sp. NML120448 TaxID=2932816 RepID=UPI001FF68F5F|nr:lecithin retinol acyltransferase family protein [Anaerobiospirillum sp. NML120448]MCK0515378.1 lecithin retinol acyltransferase family protein [Anaerobiospirillum sp. NML120448]
MDNINPLLKLGDHLIARRVGYTHHGLYLGDGNVLEYLMNEGVTIVPLSSFANGHEIFIREHKNARYQGIQAVNRGMLRLGENHYNLLTRNCEHFVNWCIEGIESSRQVDNLILTIIPFYSIFQKSDFLRGCLKVVFDDPNSLDQAFARINASKKSAYDPIERAKELSEDIFGSNKLNIVSIASLITTASQLSKEYAQWAKEKRHGSNNLLKSSLELSAQAIDNLNNKLGVSFYTQENQSTTDSPIYAGNNSKLQGIKDTLKLIKHVSDFLNLNKSEADPAPSATPEPNSMATPVSTATSPAPSAHAALVAPAAKVAATASSVATAATAAATAVATASTSQDPHKAIKHASG